MKLYQTRRAFVNAVQFTQELAVAMLCDDAPGPFGLRAGGSANLTQRTAYGAYLYVGEPADGKRARLNDWVVLGSDGLLEVFSDAVFAENYEPAPPAPEATE